MTPEDNISFTTSFQRSYPVTADIVKQFYREPEAFLFWMFAANLPPGFKLTKTELIKFLGVGERKWRHVVKVLKNMGLLRQSHSRKGNQITGSEYHITDFQNIGVKTTERPVNSPPARGVHFASPEECTLNLLKGVSPDREDGFCPTPQQQIPFTSNDSKDHTQAFLNMFPGNQTFQTFDDKKRTKRMNKIFKEYDFLNLEALNDKGAGVFLTINETDGKGRCTENITKVRAVFADLDGSPLEPVLPFNPHMVIESSPGRYHAYWLTDDIPLDQFRGIQQSIAHKFNSDPKIIDLPRVMRVPGYLWNKSVNPFMTKIVSTCPNQPKITLDEVRAIYPPLKTPVFKSYPVTDGNVNVHGACKGERNDKLVDLVVHMKRLNKPPESIRDCAYDFGRKCSPSLSNAKVDTVLSWSKKLQ